MQLLANKWTSESNFLNPWLLSWSVNTSLIIWLRNLQHCDRLRAGQCFVKNSCSHPFYITGYQTTVWSAKNTLNFSNNRLQLQNELGDAHLLLWNCDKLDKMQLVTEFEKILCKGIPCHLKFRNFKVALKPLHSIFPFRKVASYHAYHNPIIKNRRNRIVFGLEPIIA